MNASRHVRIFKNGRSRAVRIPKEFDIFGDEAVIREEHGRLVLERPKKPDIRDVIEMFRSQPPLGPEDEFPEFDDPLPEPVDLFGDEDE